LGEIAQRCDVSVSALMQANPGIKPRRLQIGQTVALPISADAASGANTDAATAPGNDTNPGADPRPGGVGATPGNGAGAGDEPGAGGVGTATPGYGTGAGAESGAGAAGSLGGAVGATSPATRPGAPAGQASQAGQAAVSVTPASGAPGARILIEGRNFSPSEKIEVSYGRAGAEPTRIGEVTASAQGDFSAQTIAPADAQPGLQLVFYARGAGGQVVQTEPFTVDAGQPTANPQPTPQTSTRPN
jgi:LysM repeat protein